MRKRAITGAVLFVAGALAAVTAQDSPGRKVPSVTMSPVPVTSIRRGTAGNVDLHFRINSGFHINSNTPKSEFLIPTTLKLDAPTDIVVGRITYPPGEETSFPFDPTEKLSVYGGEFTLAVDVHPLAHVLPGTYAFHGRLKYQACDKAACYPPKTLPVSFDVKVAKAPRAPRKNPGQSPHVHE